MIIILPYCKINSDNPRQLNHLLRFQIDQSASHNKTFGTPDGVFGDLFKQVESRKKAHSLLDYEVIPNFICTCYVQKL